MTNQALATSFRSSVRLFLFQGSAVVYHARLFLLFLAGEPPLCVYWTGPAYLYFLSIYTCAAQKLETKAKPDQVAKSSRRDQIAPLGMAKLRTGACGSEQGNAPLTRHTFRCCRHDMVISPVKGTERSPDKVWSNVHPCSSSPVSDFLLAQFCMSCCCGE
jgi:hypothetical protein